MHQLRRAQVRVAEIYTLFYGIVGSVTIFLKPNVLLEHSVLVICRRGHT